MRTTADSGSEGIAGKTYSGKDQGFQRCPEFDSQISAAIHPIGDEGSAGFRYGCSADENPEEESRDAERNFPSQRITVILSKLPELKTRA